MQVPQAMQSSPITYAIVVFSLFGLCAAKVHTFDYSTKWLGENYNNYAFSSFL